MRITLNSTQIFNLIETIANHPKKTDKERLLRENDCPELRRVLVACYDPTLNYYVKKVPSNDYDEQHENFTDLTWLLLDSLSNREATGNDALLQIEATLDFLNKPSKELLTRIIKRDLRAGFSASTINKVFKGLIPEFGYMQYSLLSKVKPETYDWGAGCILQTKMDGLFMSVNVYPDGNAEGYSRQGTPMPDAFIGIFTHLSQHFEWDYQYHGEVLVSDENGILPREIGNGLVNSVCKGGKLPNGYKLSYHVWDGVELDVINGKKPCTTPYVKRFENLSKSHTDDVVTLVPTQVVHSLKEAFEIYAKALADGHEGVMLKSPDLLWKDHKTTKGCKLKLEVDVDLEVYGFTEGKGKNASTFGAIQCKTVDDKLKVDVSGMSDDLRNWINNNRDEVLGSVVCVRANDITKTGSLFLPRLCELRTDKTVADSFESVVEQFENAKMGK